MNAGALISLVPSSRQWHNNHVRAFCPDEWRVWQQRLSVVVVSFLASMRSAESSSAFFDKCCSNLKSRAVTARQGYELAVRSIIAVLLSPVQRTGHQLTNLRNKVLAYGTHFLIPFLHLRHSVSATASTCSARLPSSNPVSACFAANERMLGGGGVDGGTLPIPLVTLSANAPNSAMTVTNACASMQPFTGQLGQSC